MKNFVLLIATLTFLNGASAHAAPVLNRGTPAGDNIVMYQDHLNPNLYYINPTSMRMVIDDQGVPLFSYTEFYETSGWLKKRSAMIQVMLATDVDSNKIDEAKASILKSNPGATFTAMPFESSMLVGTNDIGLLVKNEACNHRGGLVGQLQDCTLVLTPKGRRAILPNLMSGRPLALHFDYSIRGVIQNADASYSDTAISLGIGGFIGGPELANHPELFY